MLSKSAWQSACNNHITEAHVMRSYDEHSALKELCSLNWDLNPLPLAFRASTLPAELRQLPGPVEWLPTAICCSSAVYSCLSTSHHPTPPQYAYHTCMLRYWLETWRRRFAPMQCTTPSGDVTMLCLRGLTGTTSLPTSASTPSDQSW